MFDRFKNYLGNQAIGSIRDFGMVYAFRHCDDYVTNPYFGVKTSEELNIIIDLLA